MASHKRKKCTLYVSGHEIGSARKTPAARAAISARFKISCADAGMTIDQVAQALHVTPRTVRHWFSGKTVVPFAAFKLLRILNRFELPGESWAGWHMHSGKLWTPEGFAFEPQDAAWWSLIVRQARSFRSVYAELSAVRRQGAEGLTFADAPMVITGITQKVSHTEKRSKHG